MAKSGATEQWSSRLAFISAATGSAIGLGNIWRFPYLAGENGGGAFVIVYIASVLLFGIPILIAELTLGRRGKVDPVTCLENVAVETKSSRRWKLIGIIASFAGGLALLSYYSVIGGWVLSYIVKTSSGTFREIWESVGLVGTVAPDLALEAVRGQVQGVRDALFASAPTMTFWHFLFSGLTIFIVGRGIQSGLEKACSYMMPILYLILLVLVGYAMATADFLGAIKYLFAPDFSKVTGATWLAAIGQVFFSLSLSLGTMLAYGVYLPKDVKIHTSALIVAFADTSVALLAGMAIFPLVFAYGLAPDAGPSLIFNTLPIAFGAMPGGTIFGTLFFILLTLAALTSSISMLEPGVAYLLAQKGWSRWKSAFIAGGAAFLVGILSVLSYSDWRDLYPLAGIGLGEIRGTGATFYFLIDFAVSNLIMPLGAIFLSVFTGWFVAKKILSQEMALPEGGAIFTGWHLLIKFLCPAALVFIMLSGLGLIG